MSEVECKARQQGDRRARLWASETPCSCPGQTDFHDEDHHNSCRRLLFELGDTCENSPSSTTTCCSLFSRARPQLTARCWVGSATATATAAVAAASTRRFRGRGGLLGPALPPRPEPQSQTLGPGGRGRERSGACAGRSSPLVSLFSRRRTELGGTRLGQRCGPSAHHYPSLSHSHSL
jgi:hypothetical protein